MIMYGIIFAAPGFWILLEYQLFMAEEFKVIS